VPVFVDEISPTNGAIRRTIALPTVQNGAQMACTLTSNTYAIEGFGAVSLDGGYYVLGCYNAPPGTLTYLSGAQRVIARISAATGVVDTTTVVPNFAPPNMITSVIADANTGSPNYWIAGGAFESTLVLSPVPTATGSDGGVRYFSTSAGATVPLYLNSPVKSLNVGPAWGNAAYQQLFMSKQFTDSLDEGQ
jgi:hypothetical protein